MYSFFVINYFFCLYARHKNEQTTYNNEINFYSLIKHHILTLQLTKTIKNTKKKYKS
jgi:hypothetical protein